MTDGNVNYEGSLGIDQDLMDAVGMVPYERILATNMANGARFETYAIPAPRGSSQIILNGAAAHLGKRGDRLTIMSFAMMEEEEIANHRPQVIVLDEKNSLVKKMVKPVVS